MKASSAAASAAQSGNELLPIPALRLCKGQSGGSFRCLKCRSMNYSSLVDLVNHVRDFHGCNVSQEDVNLRQVAMYDAMCRRVDERGVYEQNSTYRYEERLIEHGSEGARSLLEAQQLLNPNVSALSRGPGRRTGSDAASRRLGSRSRTKRPDLDGHDDAYDRDDYEAGSDNLGELELPLAYGGHDYPSQSFFIPIKCSTGDVTLVEYRWQAARPTTPRDSASGAPPPLPIANPYSSPALQSSLLLQVPPSQRSPASSRGRDGSRVASSAGSSQSRQKQAVEQAVTDSVSSSPIIPVHRAVGAPQLLVTEPSSSLTRELADAPAISSDTGAVNLDELPLLIQRGGDRRRAPRFGLGGDDDENDDVDGDDNDDGDASFVTVVQLRVVDDMLAASILANFDDVREAYRRLSDRGEGSSRSHVRPDGGRPGESEVPRPRRKRIGRGSGKPAFVIVTPAAAVATEQLPVGAEIPTEALAGPSPRQALSDDTRLYNTGLRILATSTESRTSSWCPLLMATTQQDGSRRSFDLEGTDYDERGRPSNDCGSRGSERSPERETVSWKSSPDYGSRSSDWSPERDTTKRGKSSRDCGTRSSNNRGSERAPIWRSSASCGPRSSDHTAERAGTGRSSWGNYGARSSERTAKRYAMGQSSPDDRTRSSDRTVERGTMRALYSDYGERSSDRTAERAVARTAASHRSSRDYARSSDRTAEHEVMRRSSPRSGPKSSGRTAERELTRGSSSSEGARSSDTEVERDATRRPLPGYGTRGSERTAERAAAWGSSQSYCTGSSDRDGGNNAVRRASPECGTRSSGRSAQRDTLKLSPNYSARSSERTADRDSTNGLPPDCGTRISHRNAERDTTRRSSPDHGPRGSERSAADRDAMWKSLLNYTEGSSHWNAERVVTPRLSPNYSTRCSDRTGVPDAMLGSSPDCGSRSSDRTEVGDPTRRSTSDNATRESLSKSNVGSLALQSRPDETRASSAVRSAVGKPTMELDIGSHRTPAVSSASGGPARRSGYASSATCRACAERPSGSQWLDRPDQYQASGESRCTCSSEVDRNTGYASPSRANSSQSQAAAAAALTELDRAASALDAALQLRDRLAESMQLKGDSVGVLKQITSNVLNALGGMLEEGVGARGHAHAARAADRDSSSDVPCATTDPALPPPPYPSASVGPTTVSSAFGGSARCQDCTLPGGSVPAIVVDAASGSGVRLAPASATSRTSQAHVTSRSNHLAAASDNAEPARAVASRTSAVASRAGNLPSTADCQPGQSLGGDQSRPGSPKIGVAAASAATAAGHGRPLGNGSWTRDCSLPAEATAAGADDGHGGGSGGGGRQDDDERQIKRVLSLLVDSVADWCGGSVANERFARKLRRAKDKLRAKRCLDTDDVTSFVDYLVSIGEQAMRNSFEEGEARKRGSSSPPPPLAFCRRQRPTSAGGCGAAADAGATDACSQLCCGHDRQPCCCCCRGGASTPTPVAITNLDCRLTCCGAREPEAASSKDVAGAGGSVLHKRVIETLSVPSAAPRDGARQTPAQPPRGSSRQAHSDELLDDRARVAGPSWEYRPEATGSRADRYGPGECEERPPLLGSDGAASYALQRPSADMESRRERPSDRFVDEAEAKLVAENRELYVKESAVASDRGRRPPHYDGYGNDDEEDSARWRGSRLQRLSNRAGGVEEARTPDGCERSSHGRMSREGDHGAAERRSRARSEGAATLELIVPDRGGGGSRLSATESQAERVQPSASAASRRGDELGARDALFDGDDVGGGRGSSRGPAYLDARDTSPSPRSATPTGEGGDARRRGNRSRSRGVDRHPPTHASEGKRGSSRRRRDVGSSIKDWAESAARVTRYSARDSGQRRGDADDRESISNRLSSHSQSTVSSPSERRVTESNEARHQRPHIDGRHPPDDDRGRERRPIQRTRSERPKVQRDGRRDPPSLHERRGRRNRSALPIGGRVRAGSPNERADIRDPGRQDSERRRRRYDDERSLHYASRHRSFGRRRSVDSVRHHETQRRACSADWRGRGTAAAADERGAPRGGHRYGGRGSTSSSYSSSSSSSRASRQRSDAERHHNLPAREQSDAAGGHQRSASMTARAGSRTTATDEGLRLGECVAIGDRGPGTPSTLPPPSQPSSRRRRSGEPAAGAEEVDFAHGRRTHGREDDGRRRDSRGSSNRGRRAQAAAREKPSPLAAAEAHRDVENGAQRFPEGATASAVFVGADDGADEDNNELQSIRDYEGCFCDNCLLKERVDADIYGDSQESSSQQQPGPMMFTMDFAFKQQPRRTDDGGVAVAALSYPLMPPLTPAPTLLSPPPQQTQQHQMLLQQMQQQLLFPPLARQAQPIAATTTATLYQRQQQTPSMPRAPSGVGGSIVPLPLPRGSSTQSLDEQGRALGRGSDVTLNPRRRRPLREPKQMRGRGDRGSGSVVHDFERDHRCVLYLVFSHLDFKTLSSVSQVCREWKTISRNPLLWREIAVLNARLSSKYLTTIAAWCKKVRVVSLNYVRGSPKEAGETDDDYLKRQKGSIEPGLGALLRASGPHVQRITIIGCGNLLTERALWLVSSCCPNLLKLTYVSRHDPAGREALWSLGAGCRKLKTLLLSPLRRSLQPKKFDDECCTVIGRCWPDLQELCIGGEGITENGLVVIAKLCQNLRVLQLDRTVVLNEKLIRAMTSSGLQKLNMLDLNFTKITALALKALGEGCPNMKDLKYESSSDNDSVQKIAGDLRDPNVIKAYAQTTNLKDASAAPDAASSVPTDGVAVGN